MNERCRFRRRWAMLCGMAAGLFLSSMSMAAPKTLIPKIEELKGDVFSKQLEAAHMEKMPDFISLRIYKNNAEIEVWGGFDDKSPMRLIHTYNVCAMDFTPGTKLKEGDERTPEGSFPLKFQYSSRNWFMHISLTMAHLNDEGDVKRDPAFYVCTDYPTQFDRDLARSIGVKKPGSAICIHGNCVSAGCPSMTNSDYVEIFYWMTRHDVQKYGAPRVHILPFRPYKDCESSPAGYPEGKCDAYTQEKIEAAAERVAQMTPELTALGSAKLLKLWSHIVNREKEFLKQPTPERAELSMSMDILSDIR